MCVPRVAVDSLEERVPVTMTTITRSVWKDIGNIYRCAHTLRRPSLHRYENIFLFSVLFGGTCVTRSGDDTQEDTEIT